MGIFNPVWFKHMSGTVRSLLLDNETDDIPAHPCKSLRDMPAFAVDSPVLVAWASQTGVAEELAENLAGHLQVASVAARNIDFDTLQLSLLEASETALFLVSTSYDGDPPDLADEFSRKIMSQPASLPHLRYGLLALGDRSYPNFCGFGRQLHAWLQSSGAQALFEPVVVDDEDAGALQRWQDQIDAMLPIAAKESTPSGRGSR